jgi:hypothetical protein
MMPLVGGVTGIRQTEYSNVKLISASGDDGRTSQVAHRSLPNHFVIDVIRDGLNM